jgi:PAS domain S-box-containing protein
MTNPGYLNGPEGAQNPLTKILIVEDEEAHIELIRRGFFGCHEAVTLTVAMNLRSAKAEIVKDPPDLILADWLLSDGRGSELITSQEGVPVIPVIIMTSHESEQIAVDVMKSGAIDYIVKSETTFAEMPYILLRALRQWQTLRDHAWIEMALASALESLKDAQRLAHIGTWDWILKNDLVTWSEELYNIAGRDPSLPAPTYAEHQHLYTPDSWDRLSRAVTKALTTGEPYNLELELVRPDGSIRWINAFGGDRCDRTGKRTGLLGTLQDITERKQTELALMESEARLRLSVHSANIGLWDWDLVADTVYFSPEWKSQIGYLDDELPNIFEEWQRRLHPDDIEPTLKTLHAYLANPKGRYEDEFRLMHKDGSFRWINSHADVIRDADGKTVRMLGCHIDITGRKCAETALQESEALLRESQRIAQMGSYVFDFITGTWEGSEVLDDLLGIDHAYERSMAGWLALVHPDDRAMMADYVTNDLIGRGQMFDMEYRILRPADQGECWLWSRVYLERDTQGRAMRLHGTVQDITERKRAVETLAKSETRHRTILETAMDGFWLVDMQGRLLEVNDAYCRMSGYSQQELLDMHVTALEVSESADETAEHIRKTMTQGEDRFETQHHRRDGSIFNVEISVQYRHVEGGRFTAFLRDITSRRKMEEELRESESFNRGLVQNLPDYIIVYGAEGKILYVNPATERTLGYRPEELIGTSLFSYIAPDHRENAISQMKSRNEGSEVPAYEIDIVSKDGHRRSVVVKGVPVQYHDSPTFLILLSDITDRKRADDLTRTTLQRLDILISSLYAGVMTVSEDGIVEQVNSAFCDFFNLPDAPGSLIGLSSPKMIEKILDAYASPAEVFGRIHEITARGEPVRGEEVAMRDGRVVMVDYIPIIDADGERRGRIWHHQDITRHKRADEALQLQGEILQTMAEGMAMIRASDGVIIYANPRFEFIFGYDNNELTGRHISSINAPGEHDPGTVANEIITSLAQSGIWSGEVHNIRKDGTTFWCYANVTTFNHPQYGQVWVSVHMDISDRKQVEEKLMENRALLNSIIEGTKDAIYVKDLKAQIAQS